MRAFNGLAKWTGSPTWLGISADLYAFQIVRMCPQLTLELVDTTTARAWIINNIIWYDLACWRVL